MEGEPRKGQMRVTVVSVKEPSGKPLAAMKKVSVVVTVDAGLEDLEVLREFGVQGVRRARVLRTTEEAVEQGGVLTQEGLARLCQSDVKILAAAILAAAILDRLLHNSHVLDIKGRSYRLRDLERAVTGSRATEPPRKVGVVLERRRGRKS